MQQLRLGCRLHALLKFFHLLDLRVREVRRTFRDGKGLESLAYLPELIQILEVESRDLCADVRREDDQPLVRQAVERFANRKSTRPAGRGDPLLRDALASIQFPGRDGLSKVLGYALCGC